MRPVDVNEDNESIVWQKLYGKESDKSVWFKFNIGDQIADFDDEELKGTFYEQELQRVNKSDSDFYRVEEVLRSRMHNKRKEYFVKWLGYPDKFNSSVPAESVKDIK
ncbi:Hypothetical predicted protein [Paramuricea clavata]|uniref:Uncharacterized protein n=1 Tax=Paramuricea clavata TaxID=317549 RepID=A0A6S7K1M6_PARCT|nr:Hypothetical predicted protein [Paramuricea clavata]